MEYDVGKFWKHCKILVASLVVASIIFDISILSVFNWNAYVICIPILVQSICIDIVLCVSYPNAHTWEEWCRDKKYLNIIIGIILLLDITSYCMWFNGKCSWFAFFMLIVTCNIISVRFLINR